MLCLIYGGAAGVDTGRAVALALVHDLAEAVTGDRPARFGPDGTHLPDERKASDERRAIDLLLPERSGELHALRELWEEYERNESLEASFARDMNLVDMCIQACIYETEHFGGVKARKKPYSGGVLAEFFESTASRLSTAVGRALFERIWDRYRSIFGTPGPPGSGGKE